MAAAAPGAQHKHQTFQLGRASSVAGSNTHPTGGHRRHGLRLQSADAGRRWGFNIRPRRFPMNRAIPPVGTGRTRLSQSVPSSRGQPLLERRQHASSDYRYALGLLMPLPASISHFNTRRWATNHCGGAETTDTSTRRPRQQVIPKGVNPSSGTSARATWPWVLSTSFPPPRELNSTGSASSFTAQRDRPHSTPTSAFRAETDWRRGKHRPSASRKL